jgi:hypothetical protein
MSKRCAPRRRRNAQFQRHTTFATCQPLDQGNNGRHPVFPKIRVCPHAREPASADETWKSKTAFFVRDPCLLFQR